MRRKPPPLLSAAAADSGSGAVEIALLARLPELFARIAALEAEVAQLRPAPAHDDSEDLLDTDKAAAFLSTTPAAIRQAVYRGTLVAGHVGRRLKFRRSALRPR